MSIRDSIEEGEREIASGAPLVTLDEVLAMIPAPAPSPAEQAVIDRFGIFDAPDVWDGHIPPGGFVCGACGQPTESEPCPQHQPDAATR